MRAFSPALPPAKRPTSVWTPTALATLRQWLSDNYYASPVGGLQVIESLETHGTVRAPQPGCCALFDGVNDAGALASRLCSATVTRLTVEYTIKPDSIAPGKILITDGMNSAFSTGWEIQSGTLDSSKEHFYFGASASYGTTDILSTTTFKTLRWEYDGSLTGNANRLKLYVDEVASTLTFTGTIPSSIAMSTDPFLLGRATQPGNNRGMSIYNVSVSENDVVLAHWYFNDRAGTVARDSSGNGHDLTLSGPITEATFWAEDSSITANPANVLGYTLSGSTIIPRDESDITKDVQGNALGNTGLSPYPVTIDTPSITLDGVNDYINLGDVSTSPTTISIVVKLVSDDQEILTLQNSTATAVTVVAGVLTFGGSLTVSAISVDGSVVSAAAAGALLNDNNWHTLSLTLTAISCSALRIGTDSSGFGAISVCELELTASGTTKTFPFQEGPGTAIDNVTVYWYKTDGTYGSVASALVGVTVAAAWANHCPGYVRDHAFEYGGRLDALGAFCPLVPGTALCADGNAATLSAGKRGNPYSKMIPSPFDAAELNKFGFTSATRIDSDETFDDASSIADTGFGRIGADGIDREFLADEALTGADLTNAQAYVA